MTAWSRAEALNEVSRELWLYLSAAAHPEAIASTAEGLWGLPRGDIRRLTATHLLLEQSTSKMLDSIEQLLPRMPANTQLIEQELVGHAVGPVDWQRTRQLQLSSGDRRRFICVPPDRHYDTALGRLIAFNLRACERLGESAVLRGGSGPAGLALDAIRIRTRKLSQHVKLGDVRRVLPGARELGALARRPLVEPLTDFASRFLDSYAQLSRQTTRAVIESQLLAPAANHTLFELQVGFRVVQCFVSLGYRRGRPSILEPGSSFPFALLTRGDDRIEIWWQRSAYSVLGIDEGLYGEALTDAGMGKATLRPDFLLNFAATHRLTLVEVKHTLLEVAPVHAGIRDSLLYLMDAREWFDQQPYPHALVVASQAPATGRSGGRILVSGDEQAQLRGYVTAIVDAHGSSSNP